jgi:hypothetical protein
MTLLLKQDALLPLRTPTKRLLAWSETEPRCRMYRAVAAPAPAPAWSLPHSSQLLALVSRVFQISVSRKAKGILDRDSGRMELAVRPVWTSALTRSITQLPLLSGLARRNRLLWLHSPRGTGFNTGGSPGNHLVRRIDRFHEWREPQLRRRLSGPASTRKATGRYAAVDMALQDGCYRGEGIV